MSQKKSGICWDFLCCYSDNIVCYRTNKNNKPNLEVTFRDVVMKGLELSGQIGVCVN